MELFFFDKISLILKTLSFDTTHEIIAKWEVLKIGLTILDNLTQCLPTGAPRRLGVPQENSKMPRIVLKILKFAGVF